MIIRFKKTHPDTPTPTKAYAHDGAFDLTAVSYHYDLDTQTHNYDLGIALELESNTVGLLFPRSSIYKTSLSLSNCVGLVDSGFRGSISAKFRDVPRYTGAVLTFENKPYEVGDRIIQLLILPIPEITLIEVSELINTERSTNGFGSSGK